MSKCPYLGRCASEHVYGKCKTCAENNEEDHYSPKRDPFPKPYIGPYDTSPWKQPQYILCMR